jgi:hypothetical protein
MYQQIGYPQLEVARVQLEGRNTLHRREMRPGYTRQMKVHPSFLLPEQHNNVISDLTESADVMSAWQHNHMYMIRLAICI